jgi:flagellar biosynthesis protein FlhA
LLTRQDVKNLVDTVKEHNAAVVDELIPGVQTIGDVHKVLQNLLRERVSIRDLPLILETLADVAPKNKNTDILTEYCRNALASQICEVYKDSQGKIPVITMDPNLEAKLEGSIQQTDAGFRLAVSPTDAGRIMEALRGQVDKAREHNETPVMLCSPTIRAQFKLLTETNFPDLVVLSYNEIVPKIEIRSIGMISLE